MDLLPLAKLLIHRRNWFVNERFEVAIDLHHTDDFDGCIGEVEQSEEISIDDGKNGASKACEILGRMSKDIDVFMRQHQVLFPKGRPLSALGAYLERNMRKHSSK
jgi:hypothetical protein